MDEKAEFGSKDSSARMRDRSGGSRKMWNAARAAADAGFVVVLYWSAFQSNVCD